MEISIEIVKKDVPSNVTAPAKNTSQLALCDGLKPMENSLRINKALHCISRLQDRWWHRSCQLWLKDKNRRSWELKIIDSLQDKISQFQGCFRVMPGHCPHCRLRRLPAVTFCMYSKILEDECSGRGSSDLCSPTAASTLTWAILPSQEYGICYPNSLVFNSQGRLDEFLAGLKFWGWYFCLQGVPNLKCNVLWKPIMVSFRCWGDWNTTLK